MSTLYNRRRGAKANQPRKPRKCRWIGSHYTKEGFSTSFSLNPNTWCIHIAPRNRYCDEHQKVKRVG